MKKETAANVKVHFGKMLENQYWLTKAKEAKEEGFIGTKASEKFLQDLLNVQN